MYLTLQFTSASLGYIAFNAWALSFDIFVCACVLYLMSELFFIYLLQTLARLLSAIIGLPMRTIMPLQQILKI